MKRLLSAPLHLLAAALAAGLLSACTETQIQTNNIDQLHVSFDQAEQRYQLSWQATASEQPVDIFVSESWDFSNSELLSDDWQGSQFQWQPEHEVARYYFKVVPQAGQADEAASRWLPLAGGKNFRDLGGYTNSDGEQVIWGKLFRSGALWALTDDDYLALARLNIDTVIDLRTASEREAEPTHWKGPAPEIFAWDSDLDMGEFGRVLREPGINAERMEQFMRDTYPRILASHQQQFATLFDRLAADDKGLVFHCTAGKDRTGIGAALLLTVLGVDRDTIIDDFMLSDAYYNRPSARSALQESSDQENSDPMQQLLARFPKETLAPLVGVRRSYLEATFAAMEAKSGSALAYIQQELNVTDSELQQIRQHYLTAAH
ncbi:tyrosine-protein phosphatase [Halioxenophilus sp. WMMB6]|uniref:tyrosine-protein phosphatase n=1 Tax=Halioxenophilus sp. WMMB6 TaxID=3073815 RepID=UPI00295E49BF|nr:tyrosine-protein phosphatase [Halioxenophilus sp. WMMB6]